MILEIVLFVVFMLIAAGDCYSTAKLLRHNNRMLKDKKYARRIRYIMTKKVKKDISNLELSNVGRKAIQKYGSDRAMLYMFVFGYEPLGLAVLYFVLMDPTQIVYIVGLIGFFIGILYGQIWKALTLKKRFGVNIWEDFEDASG